MTNKRMKTGTKIAIVEVGIFLGIIASAFMVPRSFPLKWFLEIAVGILVTANVLLFNAFRRRDANQAYRLGTRAYVSIALAVIYWVLCLVWR